MSSKAYESVYCLTSVTVIWVASSKVGRSGVKLEDESEAASEVALGGTDSVAIMIGWMREDMKMLDGVGESPKRDKRRRERGRS